MSPSKIALLVVGAGRSGTSVLAGALDYHSRLEIAFEKFTWEYLFGEDVPKTAHDSPRHRLAMFVSACEKEADRFADFMWGNKITTEQIGFLEKDNFPNEVTDIDVLDIFFNEFFKGTRIVYILRDGRTCITSKVNRTGQSFELACRRWKYAVQVYKYLMSRHDNNVCLRFEDLVSNPTRELNRICRFLEIPFERHMLNGVDNPKIPAEYRKAVFDASKSKTACMPRACWSEIHEELAHCGYL